MYLDLTWCLSKIMNIEPRVNYAALNKAQKIHNAHSGSPSATGPSGMKSTSRSLNMHSNSGASKLLALTRLRKACLIFDKVNSRKQLTALGVGAHLDWSRSDTTTSPQGWLQVKSSQMLPPKVRGIGAPVQVKRHPQVNALSLLSASRRLTLPRAPQRPPPPPCPPWRPAQGR